tara:strand:+ start:601 stop:1248 length:648 start_codon:yes stop_codon:yes gene_type:complete
MKIKNHKNIKLWFVPFGLKELRNTQEELNFVNNLSSKYRKIFLYTRAYMRLCLSDLFCIDPLFIPLVAPPRKPPKLNNDLGFVSLSHCENGILIGWSDTKLGVDIERTDRKVPKKFLIERFFSKHESKYFLETNKKFSTQKFIDLWVTFEAIVKYQNGNLFLELNKWFCDLDNLRSYNLEKNIQIRTKVIKYNLWTIGLANNNINDLQNLLICKY